MLRIIVLGEAGGWHTRRLCAALAALGAEARPLDFAACAFDHTAPRGLRLGDEAALPDGIIVRSVPAGSFEQVTRRLGLLHALRAAGVTVLNDAGSIERCVDKSMTSWVLAAAGVPTPPTWAVEGHAAAAAIVEAELAAGHELVVKPLFGSQGRGLRRVQHISELPDADAVAGVWYLQRYVGRVTAWQDVRVLVVDGEPVAAMTRHGRSWITNIRRGGRPEPALADSLMGRVAVRAAAAVGAFLAGVDLIEVEGAPEPLVLEVNSMPAWQGLQGTCDRDLAAAVAGAFLTRLATPKESR